MSNIYMKISNISGNATAEGYQKAIILHSVNFNLERHMSTKVGEVSDRDSSRLNFSEVTITKSLDNSTNDFFQNMCNANSIDEIEIHVCTADSTPQAYAKYVLSNVMVAQHSHSVVADSKPIEKLRLNFTKVQITYTGRDNANKAGSPYTTGYDLEKAKVL